MPIRIRHANQEERAAYSYLEPQVREALDNGEPPPHPYDMPRGLKEEILRAAYAHMLRAQQGDPHDPQAANHWYDQEQLALDGAAELPDDPERVLPDGYEPIPTP